MARYFFAIWPPAATATALHQWAGAAQRSAGGRAVSAAAIHLTLAFLGEVKPERIAPAIEAAHRVRGAAHELPLEEANYWAHNHIVWVGPRTPPAPLAALAGSLASELVAGGFVLEPRRFAAHVTLLRKVRAEHRLPPLPQLEWPVDQFSLVRSTLAASGSSYEVVERFALMAKGGANLNFP